MAIRVYSFLFVLAFGVTHAFIDEAVDVIKLGKEIGEEILSLWGVIGNPLNVFDGVELPVIRWREREVLARLTQINQMIQHFELEVEKTAAVVTMLAKAVGRGAKLELRLHEMADLLSRVASADRQMREYVRLQKELERVTLEDFAEWCVSHDPGALPGLLERVHSLIAPPPNHLLGRGILQLIVEDLQVKHPDLCELQLSPHQLIYDMYNTISLTEIKGYAMMQFSWMLLRIYGKGNFTREASLTRQRYGERTLHTAAAARAALTTADRGLYRCNPPEHKQGVTYEEVTKLLQGYIENEVNLNTDKTCRENCAYYTVAEQHSCKQNQFCEHQPACKGRLIDCQYIDSDMTVCKAGENSSRRYDWIEYDNGRTFGKNNGCVRGTTNVDSWWKWNLHHCSYCMCLCEGDTSSERSFSLREALADIEKNKVVTGLRFVKHGRVIHLQISEGTLGERGSIIPSGWVPLQKIDISDPGIRDGVDYHTLTYEKRAIDLDELDSPTGYLLTGVRFRMIGAHLHFEIRSTPFNYTAGRLSHHKSQWISNDNTEDAEGPRSLLELFKPDIPTHSHTPLPVDSKHYQYIEFTHSDFEADAAQTTVPFIDIQPLRPIKGGALISGAGIIHRGARGSGGFVAAKLITYDYSRHVRAEMPPAIAETEVDSKDFVLPVSTF